MIGKLITLYGPDSCGKGTQIKLISSYLNQKNISNIHYHFPMYGHNQFSNMIAKFLQGDFGNINDVDPLFVATLYAMDRFKFLPELEKALETYDVVLLDRYVFCNMAFQCAKLSDKLEQKQLSDWIRDFEFEFLKLPYPYLNIYFDVPINTIQTRLNQERTGEDRNYLNGKKDIHEQDINFQQKVMNMYKTIINENLFCLSVNCEENDSPETIFNKYKNDISYMLNFGS